MAKRKLSVRERRIQKGSKVSLEPLRQQGTLAIELSQEKLWKLARLGWEQLRHGRLSDLHELLGTARFVQLEQRFGATEATRLQNQTLSEAKVFKRDVDASTTTLFQNNDDLPVEPKDFAVGSIRLGRSPTAYASYFDKIGPALARVDSLLAPYFNGESPSNKASDLAIRLRQVDADQEGKLDALPADTQELYALKGELLDLIEELNRAGRRAEEGNAAERARFNKDLILAARRKKKQGEEKPAA